MTKIHYGLKPDIFKFAHDGEQSTAPKVRRAAVTTEEKSTCLGETNKLDQVRPGTFPSSLWYSGTGATIQVFVVSCISPETQIFSRAAAGTWLQQRAKAGTGTYP